jgi:hypothetical protein
LIAFLFLELPKEPIAIFPFFVFLSPFPMYKEALRRNYKKGKMDYQIYMPETGDYAGTGRNRNSKQSLGWLP